MSALKPETILNLSDYSAVCYDSRKVIDNAVFVCLLGEQSDGHSYIETAIKQGAKLVVAQKGVLSKDDLNKYQSALSSCSGEIVEVENTRYELARLSALFYGEPTKSINMIGITGTNGKTTVSHLLQSILSTSNRCAILGTIGFKEKLDSEYIDVGNTTPQSTEIQKILSALGKGGYVAMEVSSHAMEQDRVACIDFGGAIITNLTQDHLDYHVTMEQYFQAKAKLLSQSRDYALLNYDDSYYEKFLAKAKEQGPSLKAFSYGLDSKADFCADDIYFADDGLSFRLKAKEDFVNDLLDFVMALSSETTKAGFPKSEYQDQAARLIEGVSFKLKLNGMFNVYNSLAAISAALLEGVPVLEIQKALAATEPVAGRFEVIKNEKSPFCVVDYAHSPDGLENVLKGGRALLDSHKNDGKLICVFGCGGDRDITKRPKMGKIAYDLADFSYVTSDNPRTEDPDQIIADILTGIPEMHKIKVVPDRAQAIAQAIENAEQKDIVVIAGKGHEDYQILNTGTIHFDDREEVEKCLKRLN